MSVDQYQRTVNSLDKEIAALEKKEAGISISKNASALTIRSKMRQAEGYRSNYIKASKESADLQGKIADKRKKRNDAYMRLQKEEQMEQKKQHSSIKKMQESYERRIQELQMRIIPTMDTIIDTSASDDLPEYDVFVSHAWEDKESFVDEFVEALRSKGVTVWYDKTQMKWGDSMRARIDDGLKKSRFGVVVLSSDYIAEHKYWTKAELDGLFQLESVNGKTLLPIWHNLTKQQVMNYSPIIGSKLAMSTAMMTPQEIAEELTKLLPADDETEGTN